MKVGYLCNYTPKEIIHSAGFLPFRVFATDKPIERASAFIQSYSCSQARGALECALQDDFFAFVFTRSCDTLMRLTDIFEFVGKRVHNIEFPTKIGNVEYYVKELKDFVKVLESWGGEVSFERLMESLKLYRELEEKLKKLFSISPDYETAIKVQQIDVRSAIKLVDEKLKFAKKEEKPKVLITGSVCPYIKVYDLFKEAGFSLKDDICTGSRFFEFSYPEFEPKDLESALRYIAEKYFYRAPCPTKHYPGDGRFNYVLKLAEDCDAVVFLLVKFCEPHFFDYPQLKEKLEKMGKKVALIELEFPVVSLEQIRTRIEALKEVIE
ncbi:MAG: 2-hydroxyacyl-CoA dehydratase [Archaeoglobaceae archaeon]|nr:2-hydroxyacyl-CoA dehydratase [Archaeoglobaceae archaeon]MDW8128285.1 2-hydroxyacyl-CoA dehydratase [Archaeoglobaceae archaeon]